MKKLDKMEEVRIYVSCVPEDVREAEDICAVLEAKCLLVQCRKRDFGEHGRQESHGYVNAMAVRNSHVVLLLISENARDRSGRIRSEVWIDYIEALNYRGGIQKVFVFIADPKSFDDHQMQRILKPSENESRHIVHVNRNKGRLDYSELLSLLNSIGIVVEPEGTDSVTVPKGQEPSYDVFISYKSEDEEHARRVYEILTSRGLKVFFSRATLPRLGSPEYHQQIDLAIERSRNMVVVSSAAKNINARWVEYEWRLFLGEKLAGRKLGNLVTVLAGGLCPSELPISLRHLEAVPLVSEEVARLLGYVSMEPDSEFST